MAMLMTAAALFLVLHLIVAGTRLRDAVVGAVGEGTYLSLFSIASAGGIAWLALSYNAAFLQGSEQLWDLGPGVSHSGLIVMAIAFLLGVPGLLTANPTTVGMEGAAAAEPAGILRITRHPFLWSVAIWSAFHLAANGDQASAVFFGTFLVLSVLGTFSIDAKKARKMGDAWAPFARKTSNIPFGAILAGRNSLKLGELFGWRMGVAVLAYLAVLFLHAWAFSASPFPGGWVPPLGLG